MAEQVDTLAFCRAAFAQGDAALACAVLDAALAEPVALTPAELAGHWLLRADLALAAADWPTADDAARRAGPLAEAAGAHTLLAQSALRVGHACLNRDGLQRARYWYGQAAELALRAEAWAEAVAAQRALAQCRYAAGDTSDGRTRLEAVAADAQAMQLVEEAGACQVVLAAWALDAGDLPAALAHVQAALAEPEQLSPLTRGEAGMLRARLLLAVDDAVAAADAAAQAVAFLRIAGNQHALGAGLLLLGQLRVRAGDGARGGAALAEALEVTTRAGLPEREVVTAVINSLTARGA